MRTAKLGELEVSRIGLGAMGMFHGYTGAGSDDAAISKRACTAHDTLFTFCPPGPWARMALNSTSAGLMAAMTILLAMIGRAEGAPLPHCKRWRALVGARAWPQALATRSASRSPTT